MHEILKHARQCAIPAFDGLLPEPHNKLVTTMQFDLATWHACAKLRLHTEGTLAFMEARTRTVTDSLRDFQKSVCGEYRTKELPRETQQRHRQAMAAAQNSTVAGKGTGKGKSKGKQPARNNGNEHAASKVKHFILRVCGKAYLVCYSTVLRPDPPDTTR